MAHGLNTVIKSEIECNSSKPKSFQAMGDQPTNGPAAPARPAATKMGSRRIFTPQFKLQVLESYRNDNDCKGNQRATARKYGIHRRQIQKWLQVENNLRSVVANSANHHQFHNNNNSTKQILLNNNNNSEMMKMISTSTDTAITRHRVVVGSSSNNTMHKNSSATKYMNKTHQYNNSANLTNIGGFISPVLSYGCDQPAISFTHHRMAPTPSSAQQHYESYESSSSASLSSPLQSSPNLSHYTPTATITNTCNNLMLSRNGNSSSPVHLSHHHPYPQVPAFVSPPPSALNSYHIGIIKPEPHLPVAPHHLLPTSSHFIGDPHYYPAPVPSATPLPMPLYPTMSPRLTKTCHDSSDLQLKQIVESAIDLSMPMHQKRIISSNKYAESRTPSPYDAKWVNVNTNTASNATESDAIDLTCKKRKHSCDEDDNNNATPPAKVPKLFKPYLLDNDDDETHHDSNDDEGHQSPRTNKSEGFKKNFIASDDGHHRQKDAIIWNNHSAFSQYESYRTPDFSPNSSVSYASPPYTMSPYCEVPYTPNHDRHHPPQSSPVSGYESSTSSIYSDESPPTAYSIAFKLQDVDNTFHSPGRNSTMIYA